MRQSIIKHILLALLVLSSNCYSVMAEDDMFSPHLSDFPYRSPEATAFLRYGQYEVAQYTGNPDIRIPLYTLSYRDIQLPLELTYQGGGIRVDEEASWVGLGWNLSVGGCINYIPAGALDYHARTGSDEAYQGFFNQNTDSFFAVCENGTQAQDDYTHVPQSIRSDLQNGLGEVDFYSVALPEMSFLFFINPLTDEPEIIGRNNRTYSITRDTSGTGNGNMNCTWTIVDDEGTIYSFLSKEYTNDGQGRTYVVAWYLNQIRNKTGNFVQFNYCADVNFRYLPKVYQQYDAIIDQDNSLLSMGSISDTPIPTYPLSGYTSQFMNTANVMHKGYLTSIETTDQTISFELEDREDIEGNAKRLGGITVRSKIDNTIVKHITFNYSYFGSSSIGGNYLENINQSLVYAEKRLKLISFDDGINNETLTHSFEYEETLLPYKTSYATDFWGFYNGRENFLSSQSSGLTTGHTFVPSPKDCFLGSSELSPLPVLLRTLEGANRFSSGNYMKACMLKTINYPTKGFTQFSYEPHHFFAQYWYPENGIFQSRKTYYACDLNYEGSYGPNSYVQFTLDTMYEGHLEAVLSWENSSVLLPFHQEILGSVSIYRINGDGISMEPIIVQMRGRPELYGTQNSYESITALSLPAGNYIMTTSLSSLLDSEHSVCVSGRIELEKAVIMDESVGAGLRIKEVSNYDCDSTLLEKKSYTYLMEDGTTSGILLLPVGASLQFNRLSIVRYIEEMNGQSCSSAIGYKIRRFCNGHGGMPTFTSILANGNVGYSRVVECRMNAENDTTSIISYYDNKQAQLKMDDVALFDSTYNNGALVERIYLNHSCDTLRTEAFLHSSGNVSMVKCNVMFDDCYIGDIIAEHFDDFSAIQCKYLCKVFPYMRIWKPLQKTIVTEYQNGIPAMRTEHTYDYNPLNHLQCRDSFVNSDGSQYETEFLYPSDYPDDNMCQELVNRHILRPVVHQKVYKDESIIKQKKVLYSFQQVNGQYLFSPCIEQFALMDQPLEDRISYAYDDVCNITSMVQDSVIKQTWLWGYGKMYPVAKIEGADYSQVKEWLGISTINALASNYTSIPSALASIRAILSQHPVSVTTYTYKPLVGIESVTQPNGTVTMYEYDSFGRLKKVYDTNGDLIKQYDYNYAQ